MLEPLAERYDLGFIERVGHDPAYPVTDCWPHLVRETVAAIEARRCEPVVGVGHSLGGVLLFYAAIARPELFRGLIILDSPLLASHRLGMIWLAKKLGFIDRLTPGGNTLRRRDNWASVAMARDYFARKALFSRFDPDCLYDYALHGTRDNGDGGRCLVFRPEIEYRIFRTLPHDSLRYRGRLTVPTVFLAGAGSQVLAAGDLEHLRQDFGMRIERLPGSHLYPLERPLATAERIAQLTDAFA
jgi:pimeloyl-ACP methyl ester carboxylesterase